MTYTAICKRLVELRAAEDEKLAAKAKEEYGSNFGDVFSYRKCGRAYVKTKSSDIAKQYRALIGLDNDDDDESQ